MRSEEASPSVLGIGLGIALCTGRGTDPPPVQQYAAARCDLTAHTAVFSSVQISGECSGKVAYYESG